MFCSLPSIHDLALASRLRASWRRGLRPANDEVGRLLPACGAVQRSRHAQSMTATAAPCRSTSSATFGSTRWPHALHQTMSRTLAASAWPRGPGSRLAF
jgi:hypothetical protein